MSVKDRRKTPALGLRTLQPYVPLRFSPSESVSARDIPVRPAPFKRSFSCLKEKKLPSCNRTKAVSRFYHLLQHTQAHAPFICVPLTRELTSALTLYVFQGLQLGSDLR